MALLQGSPAADTLIGTLAGDSIAGYEGDDLLEGLAGSDTLDGGSGFDRVSGGSGNDTFIVSDRWDLYYEASGDDRALVHFDFVKPAEGIEFWEIAPGTKPLPYWIDALVAEDAIFAQKWLGTPNTFYYNFASDPPSYLGRTDLNGWQPLNAAQRVFVLKALDYVESVVDLRFIETTDINKPNVIVFSNNKQSGSAAYATYPSDEPSGSDIFINATTSNLKPGDWSYAALTLIHELGHALGLKHPFSNNLEPQFSTPPFLPNKEDNNFWTVMSYTTLPGYGTYSYRLQYSPFDIAALQYLYGPSIDGFADDTTHFVSLDAPNFFWDGKGTDTIEASYLVEPIYMSLQDGDWSWVREKSSFISDPGQITINIGSIIESIRTGSGNDTILGNTTDNFVSTNKGDDFVDGLSGKDSLEGGDGDDTLKGGFDDDLLDGGAGLDTALFSHASDSYTLRLSAQNVTVSFSGPMIQIYPPPPTEGTDTLKNIERIKFADKTIRIDSIPHDSYADLPDTLYQFFVVGFGAAPGVHYMEQMAQAYRYWLPEVRLALDGGSASAGSPSGPPSDPPSAQAISLTVQRIVEAFTTKTQFTSVYPQALYRQEGEAYFRYSHDLSQAGSPMVRGAAVSKALFDEQMASLAKALVEGIVKKSASEATKLAATADIQAALGLGADWTIGKVIYTVFGNLAAKPLSDPTWGGTAKQFANQVAVAKYYTDSLSQSTEHLATLRSVLEGVNESSDVSSTEALTSLIGIALLQGPGG